MSLARFAEKSHQTGQLEQFSRIENPPEPWRVMHSLPEVLLLVVCGIAADCGAHDHTPLGGNASGVPSRHLAHSFRCARRLPLLPRTPLA